MDLQIKHALVMKVMGMAWSRGQVTQLRNRGFKSYSQFCLKYSSTNAEKSQNFPPRIRIPCALRIKLESKNHPLRSHADAPYFFSALRFRSPFGSEFLNSRMPVNVSCYGLLSGLRPTYHCSGSTRSFSQIPGVGTRNDVVRTGGSGNERNDFLKKLNNDNDNNNNNNNKHCKGKKEVNATSTDGLGSEGKAAAVGNVNSFPLVGQQIVKDNSRETSKGKEKLKQRPNSKKKQNQSSSGCASSIDSGQISSPNEILNNKRSPVSSEINLTSGTQTGVVESSVTTKNVSKNATKKKKINSRGSSILKSSREPTTAQSDNKVVSLGQNTFLNNKTKPGGQKTWRQLYPPIAKSVVVVESATKAKVIQGYLGNMYEVLPSYGHVRDLAARSGSVRPDDDFSMVWEVPSAAWSHLKSIKVALSGAENLILASDPDREGEAIAWHIIEMLQQQDALREDIAVARVVFNEITESSIKKALQSPREIDADLVHAYLARRALDYLIGFSVSPLLWRKLPGCQSAGRVQSAALALICDREKEIDEFKPQEYWTVDAHFQKKDHEVSLTSHLTHFNFKKLSQLSVSSDVEAKDIEGKIYLSEYEVISSKTSKFRKNPPTPYITSTLQQDAANKLNFVTSYTMKVAQKLYEGVQLSDGKTTGLITYMRTDGLHISDEAAKSIRSFVANKYGSDFAAKSTRKYFKKVKNAQEAHEAIRPTDIRRLPSALVRVLDQDSLKLYTLIWSRTMACQMEPSVTEQIQCDFANSNRSIIFRSNCSRVEFLGFQAVYKDAESIKIQNDEDDKKYHHHHEVCDVLSKLKSGQLLSLTKVELDQHHTQPPPRYSEGSLVKKLEELGIGRPSTYASTIKVLKDRNYITMKNRALCPEFRGRMVSAFLSHYFSEVTDYSFTADMETELDNVSGGITEWKGLLRNYWTRFSKYCECAGNVHIHQVEKMLEKTFGAFLFASLPDGNKTCPSCLQGTLVFKVSRFGAGYFIGCDQHPKCKYIAKTLYGEDDEDATPEYQKTNIQEPKLLGLYPVSNEKILLKNGPYGSYVQLGEDRKGHLPKRVSASQIKDVNSITYEDALELLQYPMTLGEHPEDGHPIVLKLSKFGFSIKYRSTVAPVPKNMKPDEISLEKALKLLQGNDVKTSGRPKRKKVGEAIRAK
ncbi:hypothetical protein OROMI_009889 [Orobanche minor]